MCMSLDLWNRFIELMKGKGKKEGWGKRGVEKEKGEWELG